MNGDGAGTERRKSKRVRLRLSCEVLVGRATFQGDLLNLSEGGLLVQCKACPEQGDPVQVRIFPSRGEPVEVSAIAWHLRRVRRRGSGETSSLLGLVVSEHSDEYLGLLRRSERRPAAANREAAPRREAKGGAPVPEAPPSRQFRVRMKRVAGPRSRRVLVTGESVEEAMARALADLREEGWRVLEVCEV